MEKLQFQKFFVNFLLLYVITLTLADAAYTSRRPDGYPSRYSRTSYSLFKKPSHSSRYVSPSSTHSVQYPGGTRKRTLFTGRYCAYPIFKMVPHKEANGTETFLKQMISKCHWTAVYCNPRISYTVASRRTYKTVYKKVRSEEWRCCPGFTGENCDDVCFNCTTIGELTERVNDLENQVLSGVTLPTIDGTVRPVGPARPGPKGEQGPPGPVGLSGPPGIPGIPGETGKAGLPGPPGMNGEKGLDGKDGMPGEPGVAGLPGLIGTRGQKGETGRAGIPGFPGEPGVAGPRGETGPKGNQGEPGTDGKPGEAGPVGLVGPVGPSGVPGKRGTSGETGLKGDMGPAGPPGPPGQCKCTAPGEVTTGGSKPEKGGQGTSTCLYENKHYSERDIWLAGDCSECMCLDGLVTCLPITCPERSDCKYTYTPSGYCCPVCCPNQVVGSGEASGGDSYYDGDGASETIEEDIGDVIPEEYSYGANPTENYIVNDTLSDLFDPMGCPIAVMTDYSVEPSASDRCFLKFDAGPCGKTLQRFYYDKVRRNCVSFIYGGCEGNANKFLTEKECQTACGNTVEEVVVSPNANATSPCFKKPAEIGKCFAVLPRFTYDWGTAQCHLFVYGGCGGNPNRFYNPDECQKACNASVFVYPGIVTNKGFISETVMTSPAPDALTEVLDEVPRRCRQPKYVGTCKAQLTRFYFDVEEDRCKIFSFGGCNKNGNNFLTPWECRDLCGGGEPLYYEGGLPEKCTLPKEHGNCRASMTRYYFDSSTGNCEKFAYGGCGGNENNFFTQQECLTNCKREEVTDEIEVSSRTLEDHPSYCTLPMEVGPCRAAMYRFFYDIETDRCSTFIYGGCLGNKNKFATPEECSKTCGGKKTNYTITIPITTRSVTPIAGPPGERGMQGPAGPPGPPGKQGLAGIGFQGVRGPRGPPGPPGSDAVLNFNVTEIEELKTEVNALKMRIVDLESMLLTQLSALSKHNPAGLMTASDFGLTTSKEFASLLPNEELLVKDSNDGTQDHFTNEDYSLFGDDYDYVPETEEKK